MAFTEYTTSSILDGADFISAVKTWLEDKFEWASVTDITDGVCFYVGESTYIKLIAAGGNNARSFNLYIVCAAGEIMVFTSSANANGKTKALLFGVDGKKFYLGMAVNANQCNSAQILSAPMTNISDATITEQALIGKPTTSNSAYSCMGDSTTAAHTTNGASAGFYTGLITQLANVIPLGVGYICNDAFFNVVNVSRTTRRFSLNGGNYFTNGYVSLRES